MPTLSVASPRGGESVMPGIIFRISPPLVREVHSLAAFCAVETREFSVWTILTIGAEQSL